MNKMSDSNSNALSLPHIASQLNNIGVCLQECNKYDEASTVFTDALHAAKEAFEVDEQKQGHENSPYLTQWQQKLIHHRKKVMLLGLGAQSHNNDYATALTGTNGTDEESRRTMEPSSFSQALSTSTMDKSTENVEFFSVAIVYNLGLLQFQIGAHNNALRLFQLALSMIKESDEGPLALLARVSIFHNMGTIHFQQSNGQEALEYLLQALQIGKTKTHFRVLVGQTLSVIGRVLLSAGHISDAILTYDESTRIEHCLLLEKIVEEGERDAGAPAA